MKLDTGTGLVAVLALSMGLIAEAETVTVDSPSSTGLPHIVQRC